MNVFATLKIVFFGSKFLSGPVPSDGTPRRDLVSALNGLMPLCRTMPGVYLAVDIREGRVALVLDWTPRTDGNALADSYHYIVSDEDGVKEVSKSQVLLAENGEGNVREIVGKMKLEEMVSDRQKFATLVKENAEPDLAAMGLDIISFNVQNFVDGNEVIENLGIDNIVKIKKAAAIARAESERDIKVAQAAADKESNDAAVAAQTEIAKKQNELAIKRSELQQEADTKKAMADAAYEIQKEEQRKTIEVTTANADIAKQEREIELKQKEVAVKEQALEAEVKKQAEADKYAAQQKADAALYQRQKEAEAKQFEAQRQAEARKAQAEADRFAKEQEAEGIRAVGEAEAAAIQAKGVAEAEAMEKKAEAYAKYNKAAVAEMMIKVLPDVAAKIAEPLGQIDKITIIGGDGGNNGVEQVAGNVPAVMAKLFESMKEATGIDLADIVKADTYDAKVNRNVNVSGIDSVNLVVKDEKENPTT